MGKRLLLAALLLSCGSGIEDTNSGTNGEGISGEVTEVEPNDSERSATRASVRSTLIGVLDGQNDEDYFTFDAPGGSILEVTTETLDGPGEAYFSLEPACGPLEGSCSLASGDEAIDDLQREARLSPGAKQQFFIPIDGAYTALVSSNLEPKTNYQLALRSLEARPQPLTLDDRVSGEVGGDAVDVYELSPDVRSLNVAVFTSRLAERSDLDSFLFVYDVEGGLLASNDDFEGSIDSEVDVDVEPGSRIWIAVEPYLKSESGGRYELLVSPR